MSEIITGLGAICLLCFCCCIISFIATLLYTRGSSTSSTKLTSNYPRLKTVLKKITSQALDDNEKHYK